MYKIEELSIADLKATYDFANERIQFYQNISPDEVSRMSITKTELIAQDFEFYLGVSTKLESVIDERINQIFKP